MAKKKVSHYVKRPGRNHGDPDVTIPVAEDLVSVPGHSHSRDRCVLLQQRGSLENMAIAESASAEWARKLRNSHSAEYAAFAEEHHT